jgi:hypothetical protein
MTQSPPDNHLYSTRRSVPVDLFRGLAIMVIVLDHINGSALSHITLHTYAFCDGAEVFVFLGGYAMAAAFGAMAERQSSNAAVRRLLRRAWEIYRGYLITAVLMLLVGAGILIAQIHTPMLSDTEIEQFLGHPTSMVLDVLSLRRQPYLASVLPMYVLFAIASAFVVPLARQYPRLVLASSIVVWLAAPLLLHTLPSAYPDSWPFNPFAWQLMFTLGMLTRLHPVSNEFQASTAGRRITWLAVILVLTFAFLKLFIDTRPPAGVLKQNLESVRVISFLAIAWLAAQAVRAGWVDRLAKHIPSLVMVGQQGLPCFISGAVVSLVADTAIRTALPYAPAFLLGVCADVFAIVSMLVVAHLAKGFKAGTGLRAMVSQPR